MSENEKILVVIEPENHPQGVAERASWLAQLTGSDLHLVLCDPDAGALSRGIFVSNETRDLARQIRTAQKEMGQTLGVQQAFGGVARVIAPVWATEVYQVVGISEPFFIAALVVGVALFLTFRVQPDATLSEPELEPAA